MTTTTEIPGDGTAFELGERRRVDIGGLPVLLEFTRVDSTGRRRHFVADGLRIQLNGGDPTDDERRIQRVMNVSGSVAI
jgi:hypothetical protein